MNKNVEMLRDMVISSIYRSDGITENEINELIEYSAKAPIFKENPLSEDDIKIVRNQIHSEYLIKLDLGVSLVSNSHVQWFNDRKKDLDMRYWDRYKNYLLHDKNFSPNVVKTMDEVSGNLVDLLGDPIEECYFQRRGLIIGDVQSGKTANYTGLICKAADAGYKVVVLLTGTIEKLRQQTQTRLDEGFIGLDSNGMLKQQEDIYVGVGKHDKTLHPAVFTSKNYDFDIKTANNLRLSLNTLNEPVLFVIKKNVTILKRLNQWLKTFNLSENSSVIKTSLLMVDDEADNASINVNSDDCDPTATNFQIREMLSVFQKSSYVGFTATPFANIFINPNTNDEMLKEDLFPKDYIYSLDAPSNYIGARNIFGEDANHTNMICQINDGEENYPLNHKIDFKVENLSTSLRYAINQFLLCNAIRDLRGDVNSHRSMIVNASRFINVQRQFGEIINSYLRNIKNSVKLFSNISIEKAQEDDNIEFLCNTYEKYYSNLEFDWETILRTLDKSISTIEVTVVNGKSYKTLDYDNNKEHGLRTIVVGGMGLSRGLTLEGLIISYFYRNSKMYDTLMQMGRWFGYRGNYEDLCKIWMNEQNIQWYQHISDATDELRRDIKRMRELNKTPLDFGLRVRNDINSLLVTARNKMRTSQSVERIISLNETYLETTKLQNDNIKNKTNLLAIEELINSSKNSNCECIKFANSYGYKNVDQRIILEFLKSYDASYANFPFDVHTITNFINNYKGLELKNWDVVFIAGDSSIEYCIEEGKTIKCVQRSYIPRNEGKLIQISGVRNRLGSMNDSIFGLNQNQIDEIKAKFYFENSNIGKNISQREYFKLKRNPLLMIYLIELTKNKNKDKINIVVKDPFAAISVGFPTLSNLETQFAKYKINLIELKNIEEYEIESGEEFED